MSVRLSQVSVVSKRLDGLSWFLNLMLSFISLLHMRKSWTQENHVLDRCLHRRHLANTIGRFFSQRLCGPRSNYFDHLLHFRPHRMHEEQRVCYRCYAVCVCLLIIIMSCTKTAEPIEMRSGCGLRWTKETMFSWESGYLIGYLRERGNFGIFQPHVKYRKYLV